MRLMSLVLAILATTACGGRTDEDNALIKKRFEELTRRIEQLEEATGVTPPVAEGAERKRGRGKGSKGGGADEAEAPGADAREEDPEGKGGKGKGGKGRGVSTPAVERITQVVEGAGAESVAVGIANTEIPLKLRKRGSDDVRLPASVTPGSYTVLALFEAGTPTQAGQLEVRAGTPVTIACDRAARTCGPE